MNVYTKDVLDLLDEVMKKFSTRDEDVALIDGAVNYFTRLAEDIYTSTNFRLSPQTLHKHYYIKLKTYPSSEVGYSIDHLNALSEYAYGRPYLDVHSRTKDDPDETSEFPYHHPMFPATPILKVAYKEYKDLWIKDEGFNPTGTHKDRKAHEMLLYYQRKIKEQIENGGRVKLPRCSIISSGYAALAIQFIFRKYGLPDLKVLIDKDTHPEIKEMLRKSRAEVYEENLNSKRFKSQEILEKTNNINGLELTFGEEVLKDWLSFYDWLSFEILNLNPDILICPYGSGELLRNILEIHEIELRARTASKRYFGNKSILEKCVFYGIRVEGYNDLSKPSRMFCLKAPYDAIKQQVAEKILASQYCGEESKIDYVNDDDALIDEAMKIAKRSGVKGTCESGIVGLTYLLQREKQGNPLPFDKRIVIINTGVINENIFEENYLPDP